MSAAFENRNIVYFLTKQVDLVLTNLGQLLVYFLTKQATLIRRSTVLSLPLQLVFPGIMDQEETILGPVL